MYFTRDVTIPDTFTLYLRQCAEGPVKSESNNKCADASIAVSAEIFNNVGVKEVIVVNTDSSVSIIPG